MLKLLTRTTTSAVAVELGACSVRGIQLQKCAGEWRIHHWLNFESEPATAQHPEPDYRSVIRNAFGPGTFSGRSARLVLSPPDVEYRLLEVPATVLDRSQAEIRTALQFELDRQMPWPVADSEIAAWAVQAGATSSANAMVVASRSSAVKKYLDILESEGVECVHADILPNAMTALRLAGGEAEAPRTVWGILDLGFRACRLYLLHESRLVYARVLRGGGRELTETLARAMHVEFRIAEQYKRIYGLRQTDRGFRSLVGGMSRISEDALPSVLYAILRPALETLAGEIERSCRFVLGRLAGAAVSQICLLGAGARLQGLPEILSARVGVPFAMPELPPALARLAHRADGTEHPACSRTHLPALAHCIGMAVEEGQG